MLTRVHQVAKAQADVEAAKAQIRKAERDLERTELRAPYDGQVLRQAVDLGQVVNAGADLRLKAFGQFQSDSARNQYPTPRIEDDRLL